MVDETLIGQEVEVKVAAVAAGTSAIFRLRIIYQAEQSTAHNSASLGFESDETSKLSASSVGSSLPTAEITSVSQDGRVVLSFSEPLLVLKNLTELSDEVLEEDKRRLSHHALQLSIEPLESEQTLESVRFSWLALQFTETQMTLQLSFDNMYEISAYSEPNVLQLTIWNE